MSEPDPPPPEPPDGIRFGLDEALTLLAALEDARDASIESGHLVVVLAVEHEIRIIGHRLGFGEAHGGSSA